LVEKTGERRLLFVPSTDEHIEFIEDEHR